MQSTTQETGAPVRRTPHRADIHGLRGVAILLVVAYHLWTNGRISGGVDIFLIISAYLMTGSMVRRGRAFKLMSWLIQRFRRLVPLAALTIAVTLAVGWLALPPTRQPALLYHAQSSLFYIENWTLIEQAIDYTAVDPGNVSPFQHFWSLSVQGQVFLMWPLVFLTGLFIATKLKANLRIVLAVWFGAITVASFVYAQWALGVDSGAAYFNTWARVWEFSLAALLALIPRMTMRRTVAIPLGWLGLFGVLAAGFVVGRAAFPGPAALMPALAAALVMVADLRADDPRDAAFWLSRRPVTFIANRAYALYLWHWPVYAYWMALTNPEAGIGVGGSVFVLVVSLLLADLSTRLVERRFHRLEVLSSKRGALSAIAACLIIVVGLVQGMTRALDMDVARTAAGDNPGARAVVPGEPAITPSPTPTSGVRGVAPGDSVIGGDWPSPGAAPCSADLDPQPPVLPGGGCYEIRPEGPPTKVIVLVGDSHSFQWSTALAPMAVERDWHLIMPNQPRCRVTLENPWSDSICVEYGRQIVDYLLQLRPDHVITVGSRSQANGPEIEVETYADAIRPVAEAGIEIVNIRDNPRWSFDMPECVQRWGVGSERCTAPRHEKLADEWPRDSLADLPNQRWLDFTEFFCPGGLDGPCPGVLGNVYVYMDDNHISRTYVESLRQAFEEHWDQEVG